MVKDLVCEMEINEKVAGYSAVYGGEMFHFCSEGCRAEFLRRSEVYLTGPRQCCDRAVDERKDLNV